MVREYLSSGWGHAPIEFARDYYLHYPKVAIGHWPPLFYAQQALWTLVFPASRPSLLVMIALQSALLGALLWPILSVRYGSAAAWFGCLVLATLPGLATQAAMVMTEVPLALLILLAMLSWGRYLDTGRAWQAAAFGFLSAAAILTKGTGLVLAGVPLLSVWLAGRTDLLRRVWFWCPAIIVLSACAPWYLLAPGAMQQQVVAYGGLGLASHRLNFPVVLWAHEFGGIVAALVLAGLAILLYRRFRGLQLEGVWASATALAISATVFPIFFTSWETRHVVEAAPAFVLLAAAGICWIGSWPPLRLHAPSLKPVILGLASLSTIGWNVSRLPHQQPMGYQQLTKSIMDNSFGPARTIVISGDGNAEGALISEIAQKELHPKRYIVRGGKLFANIDWMGWKVELRVTNPAQVNALLNSLPVDLVVIDRVAPSLFAYQPWLEQALAEDRERWRIMEDPAKGQRFAVFRRTGGVESSASQVEAQLKAVLASPIP
jgi:hypothetical protein